MPRLWISLPPSWRLEDVQASINVIVNVLGAFGVYIFARLCWQRNITLITKKQNVPFSSLLTVDAPGVALNILHLLKFDIFRRQHLQILAQCIVVASLSMAAILSGPIAKYSTRHGHIITPIQITGLPAAWGASSFGYANVLWNQTIFSLDQAGFPRNWLLDYLPDLYTPWVYRPEEWNSTWSLNCRPTPYTPIRLYGTLNCSTWFEEFPGFQKIIPKPYQDNPNSIEWGGSSNSTLWNDVLIFFIGNIVTDYDNKTGITYAMSIAIASILLHDVPGNGGIYSTDGSCAFGAGDVGGASYTLVECDLSRPRHIPDEIHLAAPDLFDLFAIVSAYTQYYQERFAEQSISHKKISVITPEELLRFYQAYMIIKDTRFTQPVARRLSVKLGNVHLSILFLTSSGLVALLITIGVLKYVIFGVRYEKTSALTPESKLDWMLQSIKEARMHSGSDHDGSEPSVALSFGKNLVALPKATEMKMEFESATYGALDLGLHAVGQMRVRRRHREKRDVVVEEPELGNQVQRGETDPRLLDKPQTLTASRSTENDDLLGNVCRCHVIDGISE